MHFIAWPDAHFSPEHVSVDRTGAELGRQLLLQGKLEGVQADLLFACKIAAGARGEVMLESGMDRPQQGVGEQGLPGSGAHHSREWERSTRGTLLRKYRCQNSSVSGTAAVSGGPRQCPCGERTHCRGSDSPRFRRSAPCRWLCRSARSTRASAFSRAPRSHWRVAVTAVLTRSSAPARLSLRRGIADSNRPLNSPLKMMEIRDSCSLKFLFSGDQGGR